MTSSRFGRRDVISDLPRNIVASILERLPVRDAARTSILSSKWRYIWTTISKLVLDNQFFEDSLRIRPIVQHELANAVEKILLLHNGPFEKFVLCLPVLPFSGRSDIDHWILFLSRNGIKYFTLDNSNNTLYEMHSCIYSCQELTKLKLVNCILRPPRELNGFQNVIRLHFKRVKFGNNVLGTLLSRSMLLRRLAVELCSGIGHLNIHARKLKELLIFWNTGIESLSFVDNPQLRLCFIALGKKMASLTRGKTSSLVEFLVELPRVSELHLDSLFLELLSADCGLGRLPTRFTLVNSLSLYVIVFNDLDVVSCTLLLFQSCPNLTELYISFCQITNTFVTDVVNYLEAPVYMDQTLAKLRRVKINRLNGLKPQLLLIKLLLACSPKLETLFIKLSSQLDVNEGFRILKELSQFPRLSPKAAITY